MIKSSKTKPYQISKQKALEAFKRVKAKRGRSGIDGQTINNFERSLKTSLYKVWNRMSSGSYFPPAVLEVSIPKMDGRERKLGIPTVSDRIAQMIVKLYIEPNIDPCFSANSYGYRPNKSATQAVDLTRKRCWKYDWVLDIDIKGFFDNINHELLMKAVEQHVETDWILLYIKRWLKAPIKRVNGDIEQRTKGIPQGGVLSPILANLFLHYVFDSWIEKTRPKIPFVRYADDIILHCSTRKEAEEIMEEIEMRLALCDLELNRKKTKIVYCKDSNRRENHENVTFDFLGFTFRPRRSSSKKGKCFTNFLPSASNDAKKRHVKALRKERIHLRTQSTLEDIAKAINPMIIGWTNYYGKFYRSGINSVLRHINQTLARWVKRKFRSFRGLFQRAINWLRQIAQETPNLFAHWKYLRP